LQFLCDTPHRDRWEAFAVGYRQGGSGNYFARQFLG
jgi:hypothetical protein